MEQYKDIDGDSGVQAFEIGDNYIKVLFKKGEKVYTYNYETAGKHHIEQMKVLAKAGNGLNSYIMKNVRLLFVK